jgi:hypothetical protein
LRQQQRGEGLGHRTDLEHRVAVGRTTIGQLAETGDLAAIAIHHDDDHRRVDPGFGVLLRHFGDARGQHRRIGGSNRGQDHRQGRAQHQSRGALHHAISISKRSACLRVSAFNSRTRISTGDFEKLAIARHPSERWDPVTRVSLKPKDAGSQRSLGRRLDDCRRLLFMTDHISSRRCSARA